MPPLVFSSGEGEGAGPCGMLRRSYRFRSRRPASLRESPGSCTMASVSDWKVSPLVQPKAENYRYALERWRAPRFGLHTITPADAFTAETRGTERAGNGVLIRDGLVLTIGYLITEAQTIWLHSAEAPPAPGHVLAYDQETGFGL